MQTVIPSITKAGILAAKRAYARERSITITHVVLGAASYDLSEDRSETALRDPREVTSKIYGSVSADGLIHISGLFESAAYSGPTYIVGEVGFYIGDPDDGGVLFAIYSCAGWVCAYRGGGTEADFLPSWVLEFGVIPAGSVTVLCDPSAGLDVAVMQSHLDDNDPHPQYIRHDAPQQLGQASKYQARTNIEAERNGDAVKRDGTLAMLAPLVLSGDAGSALHAVPLRQLHNYVDQRIAALPGDKFLAGLAGYDNDTNILTLEMSDGSAVDVDLSSLLSDAVGTHENKNIAHTPQQCGAEPAGAVMAHEQNVTHLSLQDVQDMITNAVTAEAAKSRPVGGLVFMFDSTAPYGSTALDGRILQRSEFQEWWEWIEARPYLLIDDVDWLSGRARKVFFSRGNGSSTFRVPLGDGAFLRAIDTGSGLVPGGLSVGQWFDDQVRRHGHPYIADPGNGNTDGHGGIATESTSGKHLNPAYDGEPEDDGTQSKIIGGYGGDETRPSGFGVLLAMWNGKK